MATNLFLTLAASDGFCSAAISRLAAGSAVVLLVALVSRPVQAQGDDLESKLEALQQTVLRQQADIEAQREQIAAQLELIQEMRAAQANGSTAAVRDEDVERTPLGSANSGARPVDSEETLYDPSNSIFDEQFPGAWHMPGTTAAMKIGGYVNLAVVNSLNPLLASDRFIVGSIPPDGVNVPGARDGTQVTASQSRLNLEIREQTSYGPLRAFVEGDFLGNGDTFRLRHAYGQYGWALAGKTWSVFSNLESLPEQVDFEGINGAVLVRQAQLRVFPKLAQEYSLVASIEDPQTDIENGTGQQGMGDLVLSVDRLPLGRSRAWNYKVGMILRDLKGTEAAEDADVPPGGWPTREATGWGVTTSGRMSSPFWSDTDSILWQMTYGRGVGRYLNDLGAVGGGDAVFDPQGRLRPLPVFAGFVSYQHEWTERLKFMSHWPGLLRSNFNFSWIDISNFDFQDDDSYNYTLYGSANLIYFPTQNARFGVEYLWGQRTNKDGSSGNASQIQLSTRFSF